nr:MAG TPA: hypothetical protein [Bacteriophage sp.]DAW10848.1 MAG TPA: hypothetical protein [Caudoviricetes sp.]
MTPICYAIFIHDCIVYKPPQLPIFRKKRAIWLSKTSFPIPL